MVADDLWTSSWIGDMSGHFFNASSAAWLFHSAADLLLPEAIWQQWRHPTTPDHFVHICVALFAVGLLTWLVVAQCLRRIRHNDKIKAVKELVLPGQGPRFRKRDRIAFLGRRAFRSAKAVGSYIRGGQGRKRRDVAKLVRKVFRGGPASSADSQSQLLRPDLPDAFLEEEDKASDGLEDHVPEALVLVLKNLRVFGHFENTVLIELMKNIEYVTLRQNDYLFRVGDADEAMYIVESGMLDLYYENVDTPDGGQTAVELKRVLPGEPIISLLSFLDYLGGHRKTYKTVSAKAIKDTKVIKFSFSCFERALDKHPQSLTRVVQVVMVRLQRVTLLALNQYLGLGAELIRSQHRGSAARKQVSVTTPEEEAAATPALLDAASSASVASSVSGHKDLSPSTAEESHHHLAHHQALPTPFRSKKKLASLDEDQIKKLSSQEFKKLLGLTEEDFLDEDCSDFLHDIDICTYEEGQLLVEEDSTDNNCLLLVLQGCVGVSQKSFDNVSREVHRAYPGGLLGQLQVLTSEPSFFTYTSLQASCKVARLSGVTVQSCMRRHPHVALKLAMSVIDCMSAYVRSIDFALEWTLVESGKALYKQDAAADCTYVVLSGRLRSVISYGGGKRMLVGEYGRGELTGIVEALMKTPRSTTVIAVRDTEVAKLPAGLIDFIKMRFPSVLMRLIRLLGEKLQQSWEKGSDPRSLAMPVASGSATSSQHATVAQSNFSTVALIGLSPDVPVTAFALELLHALHQIDPAMRLTKELIENELGRDTFDKSSDFRLSAWLAQQEDKHRIVLYQCDRELTSWTRLCVRHADVVVLLADPQGPSTVTPLEENLELYSKRTRKEIIFLHKEDTKYPKGTSVWLRNRAWVNAHYHIKCPKRVFARKSTEKIEMMYNHRMLEGPPPDVHSDFSRLARMVTGTSVGLVLGGGGARGCSHVGMIKSILEAGIPIDTVAGVSIGAFIGSLYCQERDMAEMTVKARSFSNKMTQRWRHILELTYPYTAYFTGHGFNHLLESLLEERDIRDLWLPFFTITTDITESTMRVHDYGSLWRYVRASMSLAGYMPPLCDPHDGHLLLDGGYVNNLPADIMRMRGAKHILAIDVGAQDDMAFTNYGDWLSGFQVLWSKFNPFRLPINVPNQADVQSRLAYVSCVGKLEMVKAADYCDYIRPPIDRYGTLQFGAFDEIKDVGYYHGTTYFAGLRKAGLLKPLLQRQSSEKSTHFNLPNAIRRASLENISSSLESGAGGGSVATTPMAMAAVSAGPSGNFSNLAEVVFSVQQPFGGGGGGTTSAEDEATADEFTDEDSDNLISDEEDDTESGFLSQI